MKQPKYTITISEGCTAFFTEINDKIVGGEYEPTRFPDEEIDELVDYLFQEFKKGLKESTVQLNDLIRCFQPDSWESSDSCDQCGDSVYTQTWIFE